MPAATVRLPDLSAPLLLRDGTTARVRPAVVSDREGMRRFFESLSPAARRFRFLAPSHASEDLLAQMCDNANPRRALTLIAYRRHDGEANIIGVGSYFATTPLSAEVAFAVSDDLHGKGIATSLLARLARSAIEHDFESFTATVLAENAEMLSVFRDSGFEIRTSTDAGCVEVRLSLPGQG